ncbi:MAG: SLBB domain-containing protein [Prevotella sp.]|nr:SLBB domain-containing protein [Prevotella sp.]
MRKYIISLLLLACLTAETVCAQSSMTDTQIMEFVVKEHEAGTSQAQIVTKLMQRGVTIDQIRRVKSKYERQMNDDGLGVKDITTSRKTNDRMRKNNGKKKENANTVSKYRRTDGTQDSKATDATNPNYQLMQRELSSFMPDSTEIYDREYLEMMAGKNEDKNKRKVFGRDIFNNKDLTFEPSMNIATPQNYRLGPGDAVYIDIYGASQKTIESTVTPDGTVVIEGFGPVSVSGLTVAQANSRLRSTLGARYSSSRINLTVGQTKTIMVNVMGNVNAPGSYTLSAFATVFHALYMAGGINEIGTLRNIKVYRGGRQITAVDIYDYILNGRLTGNIRLAEGDVIIVGEYDCLVNITGKVKRPMYYEMKRSESVGTVLKYAGGFTGDAYKKSVRLVRKAGTQYSVYNVGEFELNTFKLEDEDSLSVDSVLPRFQNMVEVKGAVFRPGMYQVGGEISSVKQLIEHAEGVTEDAFTPHAVMHRMKADRTLEVLAVDLQGILNGAVADIPLRNEDVLYVPSKKELEEEKTITIHGEVMYPGIYKYADNETIEDFVLQAGGLKDAASMKKVDVSRRIINPNATTATDTIARTFTFSLKDGFIIDGEQGFTLQPFDEVYVRTSPGYVEQSNIKVEGEILYPGEYTLSQKDQRLSDIISQAGGFTKWAYIKGARLERTITPDERLRMQTVQKMLSVQNADGDTINVTQLDFGSTYYFAIDMEEAIKNPGSSSDVVLRKGDRIIIPQFTNSVKINGNVMYPNTVTYQKGKSVNYYVKQAGGYGNRAKKSKTYIIYMNGAVAQVGRGVKIEPGCEIIVPSKPRGQKMSTTEVVALASGTASIATMIATIANLIK